MKKLRLNVDDLAVTSFVAESKKEERRTVYGHSYETRFGCMTWEYECNQDPTQETRCMCTAAEGCYPSLYCTGDPMPGAPNQTCYEGCMTNENGAC